MSFRERFVSIPKYDKLRFIYAFAELLIGFFGSSLSVIALALYEVTVILVGSASVKSLRKQLVCGAVIIFAGFLSAGADFLALRAAGMYTSDFISVWVIPVMAIGVLLSKFFFIFDAAEAWKNDKENKEKYAAYSREKLDVCMHVLVTAAVFIALIYDNVPEICVAFAVSVVCIYKASSFLSFKIKEKKRT